MQQSFAHASLETIGALDIAPVDARLALKAALKRFSRISGIG